MSRSKYCPVFIITAAVVLLAGCKAPPTSIVNQPATNSTVANTNTNTSAEPSPAQPAEGVAFTMPLLDAMLTDEAFVREARTAVQLTDEEVDKLRTRARNAVLELSGDPAEDDSRSTRSSTDEAVKEVRDVLGNERGNRFISFVQQKWAGDAPPVAAKPNAVPTDTRVVVNIPAYRMDLFHDGKLVKSYKIGIGYPEFPLPTGLRKASTIIFNPTWTPPDEPWVKGKVAPGKTVKAGDKLNPLGPIKIPIGLPSLIHGGKAPARLGTFASHGCVGLTNGQIQDFAMEIAKVSGNQLSLDDIKSYEKKKTETEEIKLAADIPVELRYETIIVENGVLKIYRDVYEKGTNTEDNLRRVLSGAGVEFADLPDTMQKQISEALKEMAIDASGKPVDSETNANADKRSSSNASGKVTRNIKGRKEITFNVPELSGKGYPAPVNMKAS